MSLLIDVRYCLVPWTPSQYSRVSPIPSTLQKTKGKTLGPKTHKQINTGEWGKQVIQWWPLRNENSLERASCSTALSLAPWKRQNPCQNLDPFFPESSEDRSRWNHRHWRVMGDLGKEGIRVLSGSFYYPAWSLNRAERDRAQLREKDTEEETSTAGDRVQSKDMNYLPHYDSHPHPSEDLVSKIQVQQCPDITQ